MYIRKDRAGSIPGHTWEKDGDIVEIEDHLAEQLLLIPGGGFSIAAAPPAPEEDETPAEGEPETAEHADTASKKNPGRPRLPRNEHGQIIRK